MAKNYKVVRLLVTGGRDFFNQRVVNKELDRIQKKVKKAGAVLLIIQGGARGADSGARRWALANGVPCITMDAAWDYFGDRAGGIRNGWMLDLCMPTHLLVFPGGTGTRNMVKRWKAAMGSENIVDRSEVSE